MDVERKRRKEGKKRKGGKQRGKKKVEILRYIRI